MGNAIVCYFVVCLKWFLLSILCLFFCLCWQYLYLNLKPFLLASLAYNTQFLMLQNAFCNVHEKN